MKFSIFLFPGWLLHTKYRITPSSIYSGTIVKNKVFWNLIWYVFLIWILVTNTKKQTFLAKMSMSPFRVQSAHFLGPISEICRRYLKNDLCNFTEHMRFRVYLNKYFLDEIVKKILHDLVPFPLGRARINQTF